jgi:hypothetical protein
MLRREEKIWDSIKENMKINIKLKVLKNMMNRKKYYRYKWKRKIVVLSF